MFETNLVAVQMELTNACKLNCAECPRYLMTRPVGMMDWNLATLLVDEGTAYNREIGFNVNGLGEPLLYKHFAPLIYYMAGKSVHHIDLFTSLSAPEKIVKPAFEAFRQTGLPVMLAITKHIYDGHGKRQVDDAQFDDYLEAAIAMPATVDRHIGIVLNKYHQPEDVVEFEERYKAKFKEGNFHVIRQLNPWFNLVKDMASAEYGASPASLEPNICDYPFILLHVGWNGDCIICCTDDVDGEGIMGHIKEPGDLKRVWMGEKYQHMRARHNAYIIDMAPCNKCERTAWARTGKAACA